MPVPLGAAAIAGGAQILSQGINAYSTGRLNKKTRKWNEKMYEWQRRDSLADFTMQNNYNSPEAQMARLRAAGLNPNLVYSNGATHDAAPIRSAEVKGYNPQPVQFDLGSAASAGLGAYYDTQIKDATIENLKQQGANLQADNLLKKAQTLATTAQAGKTTTDQRSTEFDLYMKGLLKDFSYEAAQLGIEKQKADIDYTLDQNERAQIQQGMSLREAAERILLSRSQRATNEATRNHISQQIKNLQSDNQLKELEINLKKLGVHPNDPLFNRILGQLVNGQNKFGERVNRGWDKLMNWLK